MQRVRPIPLGRILTRRVEQHHYEEEQHHDGAGVDDDLRHGNEGGVELNVETRQRSERRNEQQHAVHRVSLPDHEQRRTDRQSREEVEDDSLRH
jgi:hypothetical protein